MNLSPRRISAWFRGRNRQSTLMLHSLLGSAMVVASRAAGMFGSPEEGRSAEAEAEGRCLSLIPRRLSGAPGRRLGSRAGARSRLLRLRDAGVRCVGSSQRSAPPPLRCSAALRAWAGRRSRSGRGVVRGRPATGRPPPEVASFLFLPHFPTPSPPGELCPYRLPTQVTHCIPPPTSLASLYLPRTPPLCKGYGV